MLEAVRTVFGKEVRDALRDKRSLRLAFLMPLYFIAMFAGGALFAIHMAESGGDGQTELPLVGGEHLPELVDWLTERGVNVESAPEDMHAAIKRGEIDYGLIIPEQAGEDFAAYRPATLWLVFDAANPGVHGDLHYVRQQINRWSRQHASLRILDRGVSPELVQPLLLRESNVASDQRMAGFLLGSLPMLILICVFVGSVGFSADMTAGERERRSLESLLITPATSGALMLGKWLTSVTLTLAVVGVLLAGLAVCLEALPFNRLGLRVDVALSDYLLILLAVLPVLLLAVSLQLLVAIFARSFKDAQTYIGLLMVLPVLPFFYTLFNPGALEDWFYWVPVLAQHLAIRELLLVGAVGAAALGKIWLTALPLALLALVLAARQLRRPGIVY